MFAGVVEAGKVERALDLVERLHLEKSFDIAMTVADSHRKLVDLIEEAKDRRFNAFHESLENDDQFTGDPYDDDDSSERITPDSNAQRKRGIQNDDKEQRPVRRKGLS